VIPSTAQAAWTVALCQTSAPRNFTRDVRAIVGDDVDIEVYEYWPGTRKQFRHRAFPG